MLLLCRASSCLRPGHAAFKLPALCMRAVLDELAQHVPHNAPQDGASLHDAALDKAVLSSVAIEGELDARFLQMCCLQLSTALQVGLSSRGRRQGR